MLIIMARFTLLCLLILCSCKSFLSLRLPFQKERISFLNNKSISKHIATATTIASFLLLPLPSNAFGPIEIPLNILSYKEVPLCNGQKPIMPGQKAGEGLFPVCIEVEIEVIYIYIYIYYQNYIILLV